MEFNIKYSIFFYLIILLLIYLWKPSIFNFDTENKRRKYILLFALIIIISFISMYIKIIFESL
jgi:Kef-type K+ transport system membrane component KefB